MQKKILLQAGIGFTIAKGIMDLLGHIDLIVERYHDPSWLGVVYNYIISFPPTINLIIMLSALSLYWYSSKAKIDNRTAIKPDETRKEDEIIADLINIIRNDIWVNRLFLDLIYGRRDTAPAIVSVWRQYEDGGFYYVGKNKIPTQEEQNERVALAWLVSKGLAKPAQDPVLPESEHWYFMEQRGVPRKVKEKYQSLYRHENRNFQG